jgi:hypothetical protein
MTQLDTHDDRFAILAPEALKRSLVAFQRLLADGELERRGIRRRFGCVEWIGRTAALRAADLVARG